MLTKLLTADGRAVLEAIMRHIPSGLTLAAAPDATILRVSDYASKLLGRPLSELEGIGLESHVEAYGAFDPRTEAPAEPEDLPLTRAIRYGEVVRDEEWLVTDAAGARIPVLCNAGPIIDRQGAILGGVLAWSDLRTQKDLHDALKAMVDQRDRLIHEIHHQVKTHLHIVASILRLDASGYNTDCARFAEAVGRRLDLLATAHELALKETDRDSLNAGEYLRSLCRTVSSQERCLVVMTEANLRLTSDQATALALILDELVCNALTHTFRDGQQGRVEVTLKQAGEQLVLTVADNGVGLSSSPPPPQIGLPLITALARQIGGRCCLENGSRNGAVFTLSFPRNPAAEMTGLRGC